jgi:putative FmdB family regulatory protein
MPIYEYRCQSCGHDIEKLQRINDEPLKDCPDCGKPELVRLVSAAGFRLKGAGWYETDFKKTGKKNLHDSGDSSSAKPAEKTAKSTTSEKKPAVAKPSAD